MAGVPKSLFFGLLWRRRLASQQIKLALKRAADEASGRQKWVWVGKAEWRQPKGAVSDHHIF